MSAPVDPTRYVWWLVSRASGIVAFALISLAVVLGLMMATRVLRAPGVKRQLLSLHEHVALAGLVAISVHVAALFGDRWLRPSLAGVLVPFSLGYRQLFTGLGVIAAYLAALLGLSFYVRRTIGARLWRKLHRATVVVWLLGVVHAVGAGTDATTPWLRGLVVLSGAPIVYLTVLRILQSRDRRGAHPRTRTTGVPVRPSGRRDEHGARRRIAAVAEPQTIETKAA
jgi:sulfoxide reductase heme-binding subunit YedZ